MSDLPAQLQHLADLGYQVGVASGSVERERTALQVAVNRGGPETITADVETIAASVMREASQAGLAGDELADLVARAAVQAASSLRQAAREKIEFHERALEHSQSVPTVYVISGPGVSNVYVSVDDETGEGAGEQDREMLAALADEDALAERVKQLEHGAHEED